VAVRVQGDPEPGNNGLFYLLGDHLGSTSVTYRSDGGQTITQLYKAWGEVRYASGGLPTRYTFTGQYSESDINLLWYSSRWYDPSLGRWAQADTIIPKPNNSLDWDRFQYVQSNPVRYTDASGHCSGDSKDPKNPDRACWKLYFKMRSDFANVFIRGTDWTKNQLKMIYEALKLTRNAFGGRQGFVNALGEFSILNNDLDIFAANGMAPPGFNLIWLNPSIFNQNELAVLFGIIHEIGHIFDFRGSRGNSELYKSQTFVNFYAPQCNPGYFGCVSTTSLYSWFNLGGDMGGWVPNPLETTLYGTKSSIDDFADSFAVYVMLVGGITPPKNVSQERRTIIALWIDMSK
jgi:RHS repeat-associated protein